MNGKVRNRIKQNKFNVMPYFNKFKINGPNKAITEPKYARPN